MNSCNSKLILIGGESGVGKTTLINELICKYPMFYSRPISYTTRNQREGENNAEYQFVSKEFFFELEQNGKLLNVDKVYGNYYGIDKDSILNKFGDSEYLIKEIHPQNHNKLKESLDGNTISILIKTLNKQLKHNVEDAEYYDTINEDIFDIVFYNDHSSPILCNAMYLHQKIQTYLKYHKCFPSTGIIDATNRIGYNKVAKVFTEEKRITTRNFHELSTSFFNNFFTDYVRNTDKILEIGPGQGWLRSTTDPQCAMYCYADISNEMSKMNCSTNKIISSVRCIPYALESFDVVVSSLGDPYFYPEAICEVYRLLQKGGYFAFSLPAHQWAHLLRNNDFDLNMTTFKLDSGETTKVYSFTYSSDELKTMLHEIGFRLISINSITAGELKNDISPAIISAADNGKINYKNIETVTVAVFQKELK